ncbi:Acyl-CoA dehydrogenase, short-chain specific [Streptomyces griseoloalbus]
MNLELTDAQEAVSRLARDFVRREVTPHAAAWTARRRSTGAHEEARRGRLPRRRRSTRSRRVRRRPPRVLPGHRGAGARGLLRARHRLRLPRAGRQDRRRLGGRNRSGPGSGADLRGVLGCFGLTEPGTGSDAGRLATRAVREGDEYVIDGSKMFITNGTWADVVLLFSALHGRPRAQGRVRVPRAHGHARADPPCRARQLGLGQATAELVLDGVRVPRPRPCSVRRGRGSRSPCPPSPRDGCRSRPAASGSPRPRWTRPSPTRGSGSSSASRSRGTSWSRS